MFARSLAQSTFPSHHTPLLDSYQMVPPVVRPTPIMAVSQQAPLDLSTGRSMSRGSTPDTVSSTPPPLSITQSSPGALTLSNSHMEFMQRQGKPATTNLQLTVLLLAACLLLFTV